MLWLGSISQSTSAVQLRDLSYIPAPWLLVALYVIPVRRLTMGIAVSSRKRNRKNGIGCPHCYSLGALGCARFCSSRSKAIRAELPSENAAAASIKRRDFR